MVRPSSWMGNLMTAKLQGTDFGLMKPYEFAYCFLIRGANRESLSGFKAETLSEFHNGVEPRVGCFFEIVESALS